MEKFGLQLADRHKLPTFSILTFSFFEILNNYCQDSYGKTTLFIMDLQISYKFSPRHKIFLIYQFLTMKQGSF